MIRVRDGRASLDFYQNKLGLTLVDQLKFDELGFSLYFLASMPGEYTLTPGSAEAHEYLFSNKITTIELTVNHGDPQTYHPGNKPGDGFGHLAVAVDDVYKASEELLEKGVSFKKLPNEGRMKGLAFAYDPDG